MTGISFIPVMIVIIIVIRFKKIINQFKVTGTTTPRAAKTLLELNIRNSLIFKNLVRRNVIVEISPDRFYLQEDHLDEYIRARRMRMLLTIGILILLILIDTFFTHNHSF